MINVKDEKVQKVLEEIHNKMGEKLRRTRQSRNVILENQIFSMMCNDFNLSPARCKSELNYKYGYDLSIDDVIRILRNRKMSNPNERKELFEWAEKVATYYAGAIVGDKENFEKFDKIRKAPALKNGKKIPSQGRIATLMIYNRYPEIDIFRDAANLQYFNDTIAKYFFYDISDAIVFTYDFLTFKNEKKLTHEEALKKIAQLENTLERTDSMYQELQDEFDEQIKTSKTNELVEFFSLLNSDKYGCILDELLAINKGVNELRKKNYDLPVEINGLLIMVKKLAQFIRDNNINPIKKIDSIEEVKASDIEFCNYEGSAFINANDVKKVKVISPGWIYKEKGIQISRPKVREVNNYDD